MSAKLKVVLAGGNGLLGSSLAPYLRAKNYEVISVSRNSKPSADFTIFSQVQDVLGHLKPDVIINLAAHTNVDQCESDPASAFQLNYTIPYNISKWCEQNSKTHFIHLSTDMVYDSEGFNPESQIKIRNQYAGSKLAGELAVKNQNSTVLRINFFGKSLALQRPSFTDWVYTQLSQNNKINIFSDVMFSPLSLNSLCAAIEHVMLHPHTGTYNLGAKTMMSKADFCIYFAEKFFPEAKLLMTPIKLEELKLKAPRPHLMAMDSSHFEKTFNYKLQTLEQEINSVLMDYGK